MHLPKQVYQIETLLRQHLSVLRPAQRRGLAVWVFGSMLAKSACLNMVLSVYQLTCNLHTVRGYLKEFYRDGHQKAAPCSTQVDVDACFAPLLSWVLTLWRGPELPLAIDATTLKDRVTCLAISVLYRGSAMPVAWHMLPGNKKGAFNPHILALLEALKEVVPRDMRVLVMADRGLWSPRLYEAIRVMGWNPLMRVQTDSIFRPEGFKMVHGRDMVSGHDQAWVGEGEVFKDRERRRALTLVVLWLSGHKEPVLCVTDVAPHEVGVLWYSLRMHIELGFRALKSLGFQFERSRRTDCGRVSRHWLILAVATLLAMAWGTRVEDAQEQGIQPGRLRIGCRQTKQRGRGRIISVLQQGWGAFAYSAGTMLLRWRCLWLLPESLPVPDPKVQITIHDRLRCPT